MIRHQLNTNLTLQADPYYMGLQVQTQRGPLVREYLDRTLQVIDAALNEYSRVFAFRVDLRFPMNQVSDTSWDNSVIERFIASLKAKIRHNRNRAKVINIYAHDTSVRYVWCREVGSDGRPHYHLAILLNNDAFFTLGQFQLGRDNLFNRLCEAWASAIGVSVEQTFGLVHIPDDPCYLLLQNDRGSISPFFHRVSYLSKAETKQYGSGVHGFGASRY